MVETVAIGWAVSPIISYMVNKTLDCLKKPLKCIHGMEADVENLKQILPEVQSVVLAAETLKFVNPPQVDLLCQMKEAVYDAEDVVDEFNYRLLKAEAAKEDSKPAQFVTKAMAGMRRAVGADPLQTSLSKAIKSLQRVDRTANAFIRAINLQYVAHQVAGQSSGPQQAPTANSRVTTSIVHEQKVVGRDAEIKNIVDKIKEQAGSSAPPLVISVVGVGGIGKTTLAQKVYNHEEIAANVFDVKMWVFVENTFNFDTVTKQVLAKIKGETIDCDSLDTVQHEISKELGPKKFLLILDDVWVDEKKDDNKYNNSETWKKFFSPFHQCKGGSSILVTTRLASIKNMIGDCIKFDLKVLSKEDSEELFMSYAFPEGVGKRRELEAIGKDIVKKLKGLPLALKVVGGQLRGNYNIEHWENVRKNNVSATANVMHTLKLSYDHLPSHLKPCFGYCSLFPKGYRFTENKIEQLIHMWIAQGFVYNKDGSDSSLEDIGRSYFDDLCSRSFFQQRKRDEFDRTGWYERGYFDHDLWSIPFFQQRKRDEFDQTRWYVMHDLINDLAKFVSREECWQIGSHQSNSPSTLLRHVSVFATDLHVLRTSTNIQLDKLRTLLVLNTSVVHICTQMEDDTMLASLTGARVLDLSGCCIEKLPETIIHMIHLRYLAFDSTSTFLPETCSMLFNLQVVFMAVHTLQEKNKHVSCSDRFKVRGLCKKGLDCCAPKNMSTLNNLSHVYVPSTGSIEITGRWKIKEFHKIAHFSLQHDNKLEYIQDIRFQGKLIIGPLGNVSRAQDARKAQLHQSEHIKDLTLVWQPFDKDSRDTDDDVMDALKPPSNLPILDVYGYHGSKCPSWLKNNYLTGLSSLCLRECTELRELPPLGQLPNLEELRLYALISVKEISLEFYGTNDNFGGFSSLYYLELDSMPNLVEWSMPEWRPLFPLLEKVSIRNCHNLGRIPNIFPITEGYKELRIDYEDFIFAPTCSSVGRETLNKLGEMLELKRGKTLCGKVRIFWKVTDRSAFKLVGCGIKSLYKKQTCKLEMLDFHSHPEVVKELYIFYCEARLPQDGFTEMCSLEKLSIERSDICQMFGGYQVDDYVVTLLPTSLKYLIINECVLSPNVVSRCFRSLSSLLQLEIKNVKLIEFEGMTIDLHWLTNLTELRIINCKILKGINGLKAHTLEFRDDLDIDSSEDVIIDLQHSRGLKVLHISCCRGRFKLINCIALASLTELVIDNCPGLIIDPIEFCFLKFCPNLELKLNDWDPPLQYGEIHRSLEEIKLEDAWPSGKSESEDEDASQDLELLDGAKEDKQEDGNDVQEAECDDEITNGNNGPQEAQQTIEFDKHEAVRNEEFRREIEQALLESKEP